MASNKQLTVAVHRNVVTIEIICADAYEARVVHDDIAERMESGDGLSLKFSAPPQRGKTEAINS